MTITNSELPKQKLSLHPRNRHRERYDFKLLIEVESTLKPFVHVNKFGDESIDFFDANAVKALNKAILKQYYQLNFWDIPIGYLCPPVPGRADYIHNIADLLASVNDGKVPIGKQITCLDVGVGANCIYPIIGEQEYAWQFVGSDINEPSIQSAKKIVSNNSSLAGKVEIRHQKNKMNIFNGIIYTDERFDITLCNPPFHASKGDAQVGTIRKLNNLKQRKVLKPVLNFGGQNNELRCNGGELAFIQKMIFESKHFATSCFWFTTLVSKQSNLKAIYAFLKTTNIAEMKTIEMSQGNKISRVVAWTFLNKKQQDTWRKLRWV